MAINFLIDGQIPDGAKLSFGDGQDLDIYHDGSNSFIEETGTGSLYVRSGAIRLQGNNGENMIYGAQDSAVYIYHNNVKKIETTATGVTITGGFVTTASSDCAGLNMTADIAMGSNDITDSNSSPGTAGQVLSSLGAGNGVDWIDAATGTVTGTGAATRVAFWSGTSSLSSNANLYWDNTNSRLGVGTASPGVSVDIQGTAAQSLRVKSDDSATIIIDSDGDDSGTAGSYLHYRDTGATKWTLYKETNNDFYLHNVAASKYPIHAKAGGDIVLMEDGNNLGVGASSPSYKLHVRGTVDGNVNTAVENTSTGTDAYATYRLVNNSISNAALFLNGSNNTNYAGGSSLNLYQGSNNPLGFVTNNVSRMIVTGAGDVGIGTNSPSNQFHVETSDDTVARFQSTDAIAKLRIQDDVNSAYVGTTNTENYFGPNSSAAGVGNLRINTANSNSGQQGYAGFGATPSAAAKFKVGATINTSQDLNMTGVYSDLNVNGTDTLSADRTFRGFFADVDSTATGGDTNNEVRLYGLDSQVTDTGDADLIYAVNGQAYNTRTSALDNTTQMVGGRFSALGDNSAGTLTGVYGVYGSARNKNSGIISGLYGGRFDINSSNSDSDMPNVYGVYAKVEPGSSYSGTITTARGGYFEVESEAGNTFGVAHGVQVHIDHNGGTITDAFQLYLQTSGTISDDNWGIYSTGADKHRLDGTLQVGTITTPDYIVHQNDITTKFGFSAADTFVVRTNDVERFSVNNSGVALSSGSRVTAILDEDDMATDSNTALATQQSIKKYVDDSVSGATVYKGTWDPSSGTYGNPDLSTASLQVNGQYYICSTTGTATPNGAGTTPDSWNTGDWVIWNDDLGASGLWQKIDNSAVISGAGTGQKVAKWDGSGTSETLADGPITFSTNDSTFAGDVTVNGGDIYLALSGSTQRAVSSTGTNSMQIGDAGTQLLRFKNAAGVSLDIAADGDATFIAQVDVGTKLLMNNNQELRWKDSGGTERTMLELDSSNDTYLGTSAGGNLYLVNGSSYTTALTIDSSQDALFASDVSVTAKLAVGATSVHASYDLYNQGTFYSNGAATINANLTVDAGSISISADGLNATVLSESGSGDFEINTVADMVLDAGGGDILLRDDGTEFGRLSNNSGSGIILKSSATNSSIYIQPNGTGNVYAQTDTLIVTADDTEDAKLLLRADAGDDDGDDWYITNTGSGGSLQFTNDKTGSQLANLTLTPQSPSSSAVAAFAGNITGSQLTLSTINQIGSDTDKFLMSDSGVIKYVTGSTLRSYIGAGTGTVTGSGAANRLAIWSGSSSLTSDSDLVYSDGAYLKLNGFINQTISSAANRTYYIADTGGTDSWYLIGQIQSGSSGDGACNGNIQFAYDYGTTTNNCTLHFDFAQRSSTTRGTWWYENDDQDTSGNRVHAQLRGGGGNLYVYVVARDFAKCAVQTWWRDGSNVVNSGTLTAIAEPTSQTLIYDTANAPTAEIHVGSAMAESALIIGADGTPEQVAIFEGSTNEMWFQQGTSGGSVVFQTDTFTVQGYNGTDTLFTTTRDGATKLYYNNTERWETLSDGAGTDGDIIETIANGGSKRIGFNVGDSFTENSETIAHYGISNAGNDAADGGIVLSGYFGLKFATNGNIRARIMNTGDTALLSHTLIAGFDENNSSTSYYYIPFNSISEGTSNQYYRNFACPNSGRVVSIMMMHTSGTAVSLNTYTTQLRVIKNGSTAATSGELTASDGNNDGSYIEYTPDLDFNKGDRLGFQFSKSNSIARWRGTSVTIMIELDDYNLT